MHLFNSRSRQPHGFDVKVIKLESLTYSLMTVRVSTVAAVQLTSSDYTSESRGEMGAA